MSPKAKYISASTSITNSFFTPPSDLYSSIAASAASNLFSLFRLKITADNAFF